MWDEVEDSLKTYHVTWDKLIDKRADKEFFTELKPTAVGWKVADFDEYQELLNTWQADADKIVQVWMNDRWIAKLHLKNHTLPGDISIIKLMQRRPGSADALGLDHVDFYGPNADVDKAEAVLANESDLKWTHETNDIIPDYKWISIWFESTEAKIKPDTVLDIVIAELAELNKQIIG